MRRNTLILVTTLLWGPVALAQHDPSAAASNEAGAADGSGQVAEVRSKLDQLDHWLAGGSSQPGWNRYLMTEQLLAQLASEKPDAAVVSQVISRYRSSLPGLDLPRFVAVRKALERWVAGSSFYDRQLPEIVRRAQYSAPVAEALERQRGRVLSDVMQVDQHLRRVRTGSSWRRYLQLDQLIAALRQPQPDATALETSARRFESGYQGLEQPLLRRASVDLRRYLNMRAAQQDQKLPDEFKTEIELLSAALGKEPPAKIVDLNPIVHAVDWLFANDQAPEAVQAIENRFPFKNAFLTVSGKIVQASFEERLDDLQSIREFQGGARISGSARTVGTVSAVLVPSSHEAAWDTLFQGRTTSRTTARQRSAVVGLAGETELSARKRVVFTPEGVKDYASMATAETHMQTTGVGSTVGGIRGCIVTKVAGRRAAGSIPQAEQTTNQRAEQTLRARLEERADKQLAEANRAYWQSFRQPLAEKGQFPADLAFLTTRDYIFASGTFTGIARLGAPTLPPNWSTRPDMGLVLHETAANSLGQGLFAGQTLRSEEVKDRYRKNFGKLPSRFEEEEEREPWSITFADQDPIEVHFRDNGMRITVRGQRYTTGQAPNERAYQGMNVTAAYKFEATPQGVKGVRQGELEIFPPGFVPGQRSLSVREQTLRRMLERRMGKIFTAEIGGDDVVLPGRFEKAGSMRTTEMAGSDGWLVMAWQQKLAAPTQTALARAGDGTPTKN